MAIAVFTPPRNPDVGQHSQDKHRRRVIQLGDGYTKREVEGVNAIQRTRQLSWSGLNQTDYDALIGFCEGINVQPFYYAVPGQPTAAWTLVEWSHGHQAGLLYTVSIAIEQVYDLDV